MNQQIAITPIRGAIAIALAAALGMLIANFLVPRPQEPLPQVAAMMAAVQLERLRMPIGPDGLKDPIGVLIGDISIDGLQVPDPGLEIMQPDVRSLPPGADTPAWERFAATSPPDSGRPKIAIVIDDLGLNARRGKAITDLPAKLTLAYLPYAERLADQVASARRQGHEIIVHMPMEPKGAGTDPGPHALLTSLSPREIERRLQWNLNRFDGYVGLNNHMGSRFTEDRARMLMVMMEAKRRQLLFLDSRTTSKSVAAELAKGLGVPVLERDIFLDNTPDELKILAQLRKTEKIARQRGYAIAIGHPYPETAAALDHWIANNQEFDLVPLSALMEPAGLLAAGKTEAGSAY